MHAHSCSNLGSCMLHMHHITFDNNVCVDHLAQPFQCLGILLAVTESKFTRDWLWCNWLFDTYTVRQWRDANRRWRWLFDAIICIWLIGSDIEDIYVQNPIMLMRCENAASTNDNQWYAISVRLSFWGELCTTKDPFGSNWRHGDTNGIWLDIICAGDFQETPHHDKSTFPMFPCWFSTKVCSIAEGRFEPLVKGSQRFRFKPNSAEPFPTSSEANLNTCGGDTKVKSKWYRSELEVISKWNPSGIEVICRCGKLYCFALYENECFEFSLMQWHANITHYRTSNLKCALSGML